MMRRPRMRQIAVVIVVLAAGIGAIRAQAAADDPVIYRLDKTSTYESGCFGPCMCPVLLASGLRGTFLLAPLGFDGLFANYKVTDVNWLVSLNGSDQRITGSGSYKVGGEFALQQELVLDLVIGDQPSQHFDSGLVPVSVSFPAFDVTISINSLICFDTVIGVRATPVPPAEIHPYRLLSGSTFQSGCFGACACPLGPKEPIYGAFTLVDMPPVPPFNEFAVVDIRWQVVATDGSLPVSIPVRGDGFYRYGGDVTIQHQLGLDLLVGAQPLTHFDSGLVPGGGNFPRINSLISIHAGASCPDTFIEVRAAPRRLAARYSLSLPDWTAPQ